MVLVQALRLFRSVFSNMFPKPPWSPFGTLLWGSHDCGVEGCGSLSLRHTHKLLLNRIICIGFTHTHNKRGGPLWSGKLTNGQTM